MGVQAVSPRYKSGYVPTAPIRLLVKADGRSYCELSIDCGWSKWTLGKTLSRAQMCFRTADRILCALGRTEEWHADPVLARVFGDER